MNRNLLLFLFSFFLFNQLFFAQISMDDFNRFDDSVRKLMYNHPDKAIKLSKKFLNRAKRNNSTDYITKSYCALGVAYEIKNRIDSTLYYYYKALNLYELPKDVVQLKFSIGVIYEKEGLYEDAFELFEQALIMSKSNDFELAIDRIKTNIALIKVKIGESEEAIGILENVYYKRKQDKDEDLKFVRKSLIEAYLKSGRFEESNNLIKEGENEARESENIEFLYYMGRLQANSYFLSKEFELAKEKIDESRLFAKQLKNDEFLNEINYLHSKVLFEEKDYLNSKNLVRSILDNNSVKTQDQLSKYYLLLADVFKRVDSFDLSSQYFEKHIKEEEAISKKKILALERIHNIAINEEVLEKQKQKQTKWFWIIICVVLLFLVVTLFLFFKNKSRINQKRFDDLMLRVNTIEAKKARNRDEKDGRDEKEQVLEERKINLSQNIEDNVLEVIESTLSNADSGYVINDKKVEEILVKLQTLEDKMYFLRQDCTQHNMAKKLKTNTSYLSKIINTHLDKTFSAYINELRINYAIIELKNNTRLRSYSVRAIAQELGYKNADAFSKYFKEATGISPFVYIKKIQEI